MVVKKANGRIFGASLTKTEQKALEMEIQRHYSEYIKKFENEIEAMVLWNLHAEMGFGKERLLNFRKTFSQNMSDLISRYEMEDGDTAWLCLNKLKDCGIDIEKLNRKDNGL